MQAQVEKRRDLGESDTQDNDQPKHPVVHDKGNKLNVLNDVDIPTDDELS